VGGGWGGWVERDWVRRGVEGRGAVVRMRLRAVAWFLRRVRGEKGGFKVKQV
jgi:hypothetical protein